MSKERRSGLGNSPFEQPLDWLDEENRDDAVEDTPNIETNVETTGEGGGAEKVDSTRQGLQEGYCRYTMIVRVDHKKKLDWLYALEKFENGSKSRTKKEIVEAIFEQYFMSLDVKWPEM